MSVHGDFKISKILESRASEDSSRKTSLDELPQIFKS